MKAFLRNLAHAAGRAAFALYGAWAWFHGPRPRVPVAPAEVRRILVIRLDLLGDVVFSLPAIEALAEGFPGSRVDVLVLPYAAQVVQGLPAVGRVHQLDVNAYRRPRGWTGTGALFGVLRDLRREHYDLAVGLSGLMGGVFAVASGARWRVGYAHETYPGCYNISISDQRYRRRRHEVEYSLDLVRALGIEVQSSRFKVPRLALRPPEPGTSNLEPGIEVKSSRLKAPRLALRPLELGASNLELRKPYVVLVPGSGNGTAKRWPVPYWAALADRLVSERGLGVALCGAASERTLASGVLEKLRAEATDLVGRTSVAELMGVLEGAAAVVAGDTGPLHLAAALGRPVVGIYGATDPANTGPLGTATAVLRLGLPCSPCYDLHSPAECKLPDRSIACMWGLPVDRVFEAVCGLLDGQERE